MNTYKLMRHMQIYTIWICKYYQISKKQHVKIFWKDFSSKLDLSLKQRIIFQLFLVFMSVFV